MELESFIARTLRDLVRGVHQAQTELEDVGAHINPELARVFSSSVSGSNILGWSKKEGGWPVILVEFDVAVTTSEGAETKGGIGVMAGIVTLGSAGKSDQNLSSATRIKFAVPLLLPAPDQKQRR